MRAGSPADGAVRRPGSSLELRGAVRDARDRWAMRRDRSYRDLAAGYELPDGSRRVYCHHVRKTAGTSLFLSFSALGGEDPLDVWRRIIAHPLRRTISGGYALAVRHRLVLAEGAYFFGRSHTPAPEQPLPPGTFTVTILRDPANRVRSYFDYLLVGDDPATPAPVGPAERARADGGFDRFLEVVPDRHLLTQLGMFSTGFDVSEAVDGIAACSSVFFAEDYAAGLAALSRRLAVPLRARRDRVTGRRTELTDEQQDRLRERLAPEYELLERLARAGVVRRGSVASA